ncbi:hypothetical protein MMC26_002044 [Xylographa opegraphella]|nr:hypothetical protein [Xylographa opegraphella]
MSSHTVGPIRRLYFKWRSLKLPWRRRWLVGMVFLLHFNRWYYAGQCSDLSGNTFWEFKDSLTAGRLRRIAEADPRVHYSDIKLSPQWHQWLRHTRADPPSLEEQQLDIQRQAQLKQLARLADERWAAKPSFLDAPKERSQPGPATLPRDPGGYVGQTEPDEKEGVRNLVAGVDDMVESNNDSKVTQQYKGKDNPWKTRKGNPGEDWQPAAWTPGSTNRR